MQQDRQGREHAPQNVKDKAYHSWFLAAHFIAAPPTHVASERGAAAERDIAVAGVEVHHVEGRVCGDHVGDFWDVYAVAEAVDDEYE